LPYVKSRGFNQATLCTYTPVYTTYHTYTQVSIIYIHKYNERHEYNEREKEKERESARAPHTHTHKHTHTQTHTRHTRETGAGTRRLALFSSTGTRIRVFCFKQAGRQASKQACQAREPSAHSRENLVKKGGPRKRCHFTTSYTLIPVYLPVYLYLYPCVYVSCIACKTLPLHLRLYRLT